MFLRPVLAALAVVLAAPAAAQSWCSNGTLTPTEAAICNDTILPGLDAELTALYQQVRTPQVRAAQNDWIQRRNSCGTDIFCIETAYIDRIEQLERLANQPPPQPQEPLRPWCTASGLNAAERTICEVPILADLDAAMAAVYGATRASSGDTAQTTWLRQERDACGADATCIQQAYLRRIAQLGRRLRTGG